MVSPRNCTVINHRMGETMNRSTSGHIAASLKAFQQPQPLQPEVLGALDDFLSAPITSLTSSSTFHSLPHCPPTILSPMFLRHTGLCTCLSLCLEAPPPDTTMVHPFTPFSFCSNTNFSVI